jgi:MYXO-CTERM domain-containing protein
VRALGVSLGLLTLVAAAPASATWSVAAGDAETIGSAGASCVPYEVIRIQGIAAGFGVVDAQAYFDDAARDEAVSLLAERRSPDEILAIITDPAVHPVAPKMQYGIVDTLGRSAGYTGPQASAFAAHKTGTIEAYAYSIQGNLLTSARVLDQAEAVFLASGCDLADKLMLALEAGAESGEGDGRCTPDGRPAKSAFIEVRSSTETILRVSLPDVSPDDPIQRLREEFDRWRADHPCPAPPDGGERVDGAASCAISGTGGDAGAYFIAGLMAVALVRRRRRAP